MKVTSVELHPDKSARAMVLSYRDPIGQSPYICKGILGLDAEDISSRLYAGSASDFYDMFPVKREIVIVVELNPNFADEEDFSDLRDNIYKMITTSRRGLMQILFKNGTDSVASISGRVSKVESPQFAKSQTVNITISCEEPWLKSPDIVNVDVSQFKFSRITIYDNLSNAQHGLSFMLHFTEAASRFKFRSPHDDSWSFEVVPIGGFLAGDHLLYSSFYSEKFLYVNRLSGEQVHLVDQLVPGSVWPILFPGMNVFDYDPDTKIEWDWFTYYPTYWGI